MQPTKKRKNKPHFIGQYNEITYVVIKSNTVIYQAGNSPLESTTFVDKSEGVGKDMMKDFCKTTTKELAEENGGTLDYIFVENFHLSTYVGYVENVYTYVEYVETLHLKYPPSKLNKK
ncbi:hypothetical protein FD723_40455 (plasmid) [Nostoc sp. C052]|uniref:hypothetical protein n=1 Tax=Nostoc sp. C052 TaxID=2576902 RepID=UPI0015C377B5|nr:hypothetical protein [Nostoc sp. C052]QLE46486.1 hypothetical protein FD723_40455 [Nostoc sp. C052]